MDFWDGGRVCADMVMYGEGFDVVGLRDWCCCVLVLRGSALVVFFCDCGGECLGRRIADVCVGGSKAWCLGVLKNRWTVELVDTDAGVSLSLWTRCR